MVRRRKTSDERQRLLVRFRESQMTQREFAACHGIGLSTLCKWLRIESTAPLSPVQFKEVIVPNPSLRYAVEVVSPRGWIIRLQNGSEFQSLPALLQALPC